jgi:alcohol dehydrogenase class IV
LFNIHHGLAVGFFIPFVFEFYRTVSDKYLRICDAFKIEGKSKEERFDGLMEKIRSLFKELDVPSNLRDLGIEKSDFEQKMEKIVLYTFEDIDTFFSPRPITMVEVEKILRHAYEGKSINF